jgi:hypothetical protein
MNIDDVINYYATSRAEYHHDVNLFLRTFGREDLIGKFDDQVATAWAKGEEPEDVARRLSESAG